MDTLAGARPKSLSRQPGREAAKTAAVLRNPSTKNLEWYHGTRASSAQLAGGFRISGDDPDPAWPPHWSTGLGVHFAAHHSMANRFADPSIGVGGRGMAADPDHSQTPSVVHARLHVQNPKVYDNEDRMADDVFEHEHGERKNYISNYLKADDERVPYAAGTYFSYDHHPDEAPSRGEYEHFDDWEDHAEGGEERPAPVYRREQWLNLHPDAAGIARRHRERLQAQGYDGIVYGNSAPDEQVRSRKPESNMAAIAFHPSQIEITKHHVHGDEAKTAAARWSPSSGVFGPTTGHDPRLFDGDELRPEVRRDVMERLDQALRADTGLVGSDWQDWTKVYLAGGSASEWAGARPNDAAEDLDILIGVNYFEARRGSGAFQDMDSSQIDTAFNSALRAAFNDPDWHPAFGGTWQLTGYVNANAYDITKIKPYAAYNITDMTWAVHPPHLPEHTLADFDPAILAYARAVAHQARAILKLPEPLRTREARALWEALHADRRAAFSDQGEGWQDAGNLVEKYLSYHPDRLLDKLRKIVFADPGNLSPGNINDRGNKDLHPLQAGEAPGQEAFRVGASRAEGGEGVFPGPLQEVPKRGAGRPREAVQDRPHSAGMRDLREAGHAGGVQGQELLSAMPGGSSGGGAGEVPGEARGSFPVSAQHLLEEDLRHHRRGVRGDAGGAGRQVRDLPGDGGGLGPAQLLRGSQPRDGQTAEAAVRELQFPGQEPGGRPGSVRADGGLHQGAPGAGRLASRLPGQVVMMHPRDLMPYVERYRTEDPGGVRHRQDLAAQIREHGYDPERHGGMSGDKHFFPISSPIELVHDNSASYFMEGNHRVHALNDMGYDQPVPVLVRDLRTQQKTAAAGDLTAKQFRPLESRLLGKGGTRVVNPGFEPDLDKIMDRGQDWDGSTAIRKPMRSRDCHANAARLCESAGHQVATGYALSDDGLWRQHSWGIHARTGKPIETTTPREKYHGVVLTADEAAEFGRANPSHTAAAERTAAVEPYDGDGEPRPWHRRWPGESDEDVTARRGQYIQQVSDRHGVSPAAAHKVISQVAGDLGEDLAFTDGRKYGFANNPGHHEIFSEEQIKHLMTPEAWHGVPVTHVPAEGLHASQNWLRPRTLAHNLFHPGKKLGQVDDEEGHPDFDPDDIPREEDDYDDIAEGSRPRPDLGQHTRFMRRDNGTMMVVDGHHRAAIDMALGKRTTPGTVIDESRLRAMMKPPAVHLRGEEMSAPELHAHMLQHHDRTRSELPEPRDANHLDLVDEHDHSHEFEDPGHEHEVPASAHEPGRIPAAVIDKYAAAGPWLHGTHRKLRRGDLIEPGHPANDDLGSGGDEGSRPHVYAANTAGMADYFAGEAAGKHPGTTPRIYEVQPTGPMEADPELEEGGIEPEAYRSAHPLRVLREYTPPKTAARDPDSIYIPPPLPEEALERAQTHPHQVAASYAQYHARMNHPRVTMRFPRSHEGGDELVGSILRHTGYEGDTEGSFVARHPRPENKTSNPSWLDGKPGVALHPESWDYGTVAHEAAHHALMYHHAIGPNEHQPDEQIHGPEWSGYYANGLNYISPGAGDDFLRHKQHYLEQIQAHHGMAKEASSDGDRWVTCEQGCEHWGEHGAAGLLIRHRGDDGLYRYLLQKRSDDGDKIDNPGVWSIPSGAIGEHETPEEGARREYREEHGPLPQGVTHHHTVKSTDHGDWAFHTVVMDSPERFEPRGGGKTSFEQQGAAWHTAAEVRGMKNRGELHPAFAESWDKVRQSRPATAVAETYFHATAPDRRGSIREHGLQTSYSADEDMHGDGAEKRLYVSRGVQPDDRWAGQDVWSVDMHGLPMEQDVEPGDFSTWKDIGPERLKLYRTAQATQTQATADYRHADSQQRRCGNCVMFREGVKHDWCTKVKGSIEESGVCRFFYARGETHRRHLSEQKTAVTGYDVAPRTGMIYLDVPPELIHQVPGGVDDHHITLVYLGKGLSDEQFERACQRAAETAARHRPLEGELSGTETFPPSESSKGKTPAFVPAHVPGLSAIRQELEDLSASEHKDFRPHVTLAYLEDGDPVPPPHPAVPVKFTHLHVKRGDDVQSFPLGEPLAKEADYRQPPTEETWEARRQRVSKWLDKQGDIFHMPSKWGPHTSNQVAHGLIAEHDGPERDEHWEHLPDQEVSLRQPVHTHQGFVYTDTVKHYLNADADPDQHYESGEYTPGGDEPKFVRHEGTHYMLDGHHRYAKDRLMGHESMYGKVFDTADPSHKQANCYDCHRDEAEDDYDHASEDCPTCKRHGWYV